MYLAYIGIYVHISHVAYILILLRKRLSLIVYNFVNFTN